MCIKIQNSLGLTETWVDGIGAPEIDGRIVRLPYYVRRGSEFQLVACITMTIETFLQSVQDCSTRKIDYTADTPRPKFLTQRSH